MQDFVYSFSAQEIVEFSTLATMLAALTMG
jgi:hypothetical protein